MNDFIAARNRFIKTNRDIFGDIFGSMFGGGRNNKGFHRSSFHQGGFGSSDGFGGGGFGSGSFRQKGSDAHADISISFDEAVTGCDKVIHLQDQNGAMQSLQVHIPAGIDTGKSVRLSGIPFPRSLILDPD